MRKCITVSFFIHCLVFSLLLSNQSITPGKEVETPTEVELYEENTNLNVQIKELGDGESETENNSYYWGLGIVVGDDGTILSVFSGYNGDKFGLDIGDIILKVNNKPYREEISIRGDGPAKLMLTISRNGSIINIQVERGKVYY